MVRRLDSITNCLLHGRKLYSHHKDFVVALRRIVVQYSGLRRRVIREETELLGHK